MISPHGLMCQAFGDCGQGFANAVLFVVATAKVRHHFMDAILCRTQRLRTPSTLSTNRYFGLCKPAVDSGSLFREW